MKRGYFASVRTRITLWSMAIIGVVLIGSGLIALVAVEKTLMASVDRDLATGLNGSPAGVVATGSRQSASTKPAVSYFSFETPGGDRKITSALVTEARQTLGSLSPLGDEAQDLGRLALLQPEMKHRLTARSSAYANVRLHGEPYRVFLRPFSLPGNAGSFLITFYPLDEVQRLVGTLRFVFLVLLPIALAVTYLAAFLLARTVLAPVGEISRAASEANAHDLSKRLSVAGSDEFSSLSVTINGMFDRLETSFQEMARSVERQKRFVADASHELRTPMTVIRGNASWALQNERSPADYEESLRSIDVAAQRTERLIADLLLVAKSDADQQRIRWSTFPASELLREAVQQVAGRAGLGRIETTVVPADLIVTVDRDKTLRILSNLLENALQHTLESGSIRVSVHGGAGLAKFEIEDTGRGIPEEHLGHVFDRFYRVDDARAGDTGGTGLGLSLCRELACAQGGSIDLVSSLGKGTRVSFWIPQIE